MVTKLIISLLLISTVAMAQRNHAASLSFTFVQGLADGVRDASMFHMVGKGQWWDGSVSWENKYANYPESMDAAFWGSKNVLVWTTDAPHFFNMVGNQAMSFAIVTYPGNSGKFKHIVRDAIMYNVVRQCGHSLMYKVILK